MIGRTVSHFKIQEKLGQGGMGIVYKAVDTNLDRTVALKFLPAQFSEDANSKARFIQEAKAASALDHANICAIYEIGETADGELFIAMAYYDGQTLKYRMGEERFTVNQAMDVGRQLASALDRAHESGIVHRDIKPANIMVTKRGEVKLLDFGLAKLAGGADLTVHGSTLGTAAYMSPEQARGEEITGAADIWAVGTVMYEILSGAKPFAGEYESALIYGILNESPVPLAERDATVPEDLSELVMRCLSKVAKERPTAEELISRLGGSSGAHQVMSAGSGVRSGSGVSSGSGDSGASGVSGVSGVANAAPSNPTKKSLIIAGAALVVLLAIVGVWSFSGGAETGRQATPASAGAGATARDRSVAVLPFKLFSASDQETSAMFAGGMHNDILNRLAKISGLRVIASTSVVQYEGTTKSAGVIAAELGVTSVLEGTIQRSGDRVRVGVQLVDAATESPIWSETYDEELTTENIFAIQSDLAHSIAAALETTLTPKEDELLAERPDVSVEAYDLFIRTKYRYSLISRSNPENMKETAAQLKEVLSIEPNYAEAQAVLATVYLRGIVSSIWSPEEKLNEAKSLIERAVRKNPELPEGYVARGRLYENELNWEGAEEMYKKALELSPGDPDVIASVAGLNIQFGRTDEAIDFTRKGLETDPLNINMRISLCDALMFGGRYTEAVAESDRTLRMDPFQEHALYVKGFALAMLERPLEAIPALQEAIRLSPSDEFSKMGLAFAYAKAGNSAEATRVMSSVGDSPAMQKEKAIIFGIFGDLDTAFRLMDEAFQKNSVAVAPIVGDPTVSEVMMADPRWAAFVKKVGM